MKRKKHTKPTVANRIKTRLEEFTRDLEDGVTVKDKYRVTQLVRILGSTPSARLRN